MVIRRRAYALASLALLLTASSLLAQPKEQTRKLSNDEKKELQAISTMLGAGQPPANDLSLAWGGNDLLKAQGNKEYVPFTITLDPSKLTGKRVSLYWRVVSKDAPAPDPKAKKDDKAPQYAFENLHTVDLPSTPGPVRLSRSFVVGPGSYDVYVVAKEPDPKKKSDPPAKTGVVKQELTIPDLWNGELTTSTVILAERIDPLRLRSLPRSRKSVPMLWATWKSCRPLARN